MECNKEEAVRAKEIAEKKMQNKDFVGARKIALKAQQLYPNLDNITQMLTVCDVHCSAEHKVLGTEMDWYGILQVAQTADEASMKKQFRKLALLLHPDKNKFPGAEAAFKLIGEAQRLLADPGKRSVYDMKRRASLKTVPQKQSQAQPSRPSYVRSNQPSVRPNTTPAPTAPFTTMNAHQQKQQQPQPGSNGTQTFWTVCPFCSIRYQYYREIVNRAIRCQGCTKPFVAYDFFAQGAPPVPNNQPVPPQTQVPIQGSQKKIPESTARNIPVSAASQGNLASRQKASGSFPKTEGTSGVGGASKPEKEVAGNMPKVDRKADGNVLKPDAEKPRDQKPSRNRKRGRGNAVVNSSESADSASSNETEENEVNSVNPTGQSGHSVRRSARHKQEVKYGEPASDDDELAKNSKRAKGSGSLEATMERNEAVLKGEGSKIADPSGCATSIGENKKVEGQTGNVSHGECLPNGSGKAENCMNNGAEAAKVDIQGPKIDIASEPKSVPPTKTPSELMEVPESEFFDFESGKSEQCFKVDQMWAVYDNVDGMPRFYARIRKVFKPAFKVRITWLIPDLETEDEAAWSEEELPVACGRFKHEKTDMTEDLRMFSHRVDWEKGTKFGSYKIYPRKGETWALFKNWNIKWPMDADKYNHGPYEYEFVEVLSNYSEESGISVTYLAKLKGFVSLFKPAIKNVSHFQIPPNERLRFSHRVPSFKTTGKERTDVPAGCYELDPASLPSNCEDFCDVEDMNVNAKIVDAKTNGSSTSLAKDGLHTAGDTKKRDQSTPSKEKSVNLSTRESNRSCKKPAEANLSPSAGITSTCGDRVEAKTHGHTLAKEKLPACQTNAKEMDLDDAKHNSASNVSGDHGPSSPSYVDPCEIPASEFHNFQPDKSPEKFQPGQVWALYCDLDGLPKFYAQIYKVELQPDVKIHIRWLEGSRSAKGTIQWLDKDMPIACGTFKHGGQHVITDPAAFSHESKAEPSRRKNCLDICPRKGEVWALYKHFNSEWTCSELENCEYEIVEVLECDDSRIRIKVLEQVAGYETVFSSKKKPGAEVVMTIGQFEVIRFSHQVPAFKLTDEANGSLRGCWELDPQSLPVSFFSSD